MSNKHWYLKSFQVNQSSMDEVLKEINEKMNHPENVIQISPAMKEEPCYWWLVIYKSNTP